MKEMTLQEAKEKFKQFEMSTLFMCIEDVIDCAGMTFDEWAESNNITIED